ncbi:MAG: hypothetical protein HYX24_03040 [Candidatus Aenigmarchaeota archaeon]|nr:hypothetical protein [Candidatus Aenigmarchaeota archaeon]
MAVLDPTFLLISVFGLGFLLSVALVMTVFAVTHLSRKNKNKAAIFIMIAAALFALFVALIFWLFIFSSAY